MLANRIHVWLRSSAGLIAKRAVATGRLSLKSVWSEQQAMPPKKRKAANDGEKSTAVATDKAPPTKKGRGRPKKDPVEKEQPPVEKTEEIEEKSAQGIAETAQSNDEQDTADKAPPAKKGRGRPKKVRIEEQQPPVEKMETDESEGVAVQESPESHDEQEVAPPPPPPPAKKGQRKSKKTSDSDNQPQTEPPAAKKPRTQKKPSDDENTKPTVKRGRGRPKKAQTESESVDASEEAPESSGATKSSNTTDFSKVDFSSSAKSPDGKPWNLKFSSWNVNGVRAWLKNNALQYIKEEQPNIFCLQETKCAEDELPKQQLEVEGYHSYWSSADQKGYSGTGVYTKEEPLNVTYGMGIEKHDAEGRLITLEFDQYYFVTTYVPNAGEKLKRLDYRSGEWDGDFRAYLKDLDGKKPVILCGDLNVAHEEIDLANPKGNAKTAGFTKEEREGFGKLLSEGFIDTFRHLYPDKKEAYSYWSYRSNARSRNKGWRLDYFVVSKRFVGNVCDSLIRSEVYGSDHCPIVLLVAL